MKQPEGVIDFPTLIETNRRLNRRCQELERREAKWRRRAAVASKLTRKWQTVIRNTNRVIRLYVERWHTHYYRSCWWCKFKWWLVRTLAGG